MSDISFSQDKSKLNIDVIYGFLRTAYWSKSRTKTMIQTSIANSLCIGVYKNDEQIGFARILTDKIVFAYIMDVFILPKHQGNGYGKELLHYILNNEELKNIQKWTLATSDAHGLYKKFGFHIVKNPHKMMELELG